MKETEVISGKYKAQVEDKGAKGNGAGCAAATAEIAVKGRKIVRICCLFHKKLLYVP